MKSVKHGRVSVVLPASVELPEAAGKMSQKEVARLLKAPHGLGVASEQAALSLISAGPGFTAPKGVTPESLRALGKRSEDLLSLMNDLGVVMSKISQAKLLLDKESFDELRKLNEFVKVGVKYNPELKIIFAPLLAFFAKSVKTRKAKRAKEKRQEREGTTEVLAETAEVVERPALNLVKMPDVAS